VLQTLEVSEATYQRWRNRYGETNAEEAVRLKKLEEKNKRPEELVAEQGLDIKMLKHQAHGGRKLVSPSRKREAGKMNGLGAFLDVAPLVSVTTNNNPSPNPIDLAQALILGGIQPQKRDRSCRKLEG